MDGHPRSGPLADLRVLDLTQFLSGPFCTQILGDLGADVVKVEAPGGDLARSIPPHFVNGDSTYFHSVNRNKRSIVIDLKESEGRLLAARLAERADIVVENFRPGVLERLGLRYEDVAAVNPRVIWCAISGFGQTGPYRDLPAYDMIVQALSGGMSLTGEPCGAAVRAGMPIGDLAAGLYATIGITAALEERHRTGRGRLIDISMLDCQIALLTYQASFHLASGEVPGRQGGRHDSIPTYRTFTASDGLDVVVTANTEAMWHRLCAAVERPDLLEDPRFHTNVSRRAHQADLDPLLEDAFRARRSDEWVALLREGGVPVAVVNGVDRALADPQVAARRMVVEMDADGVPLRVAGDPLKMSSDIRSHRRPPPIGCDGPDVICSWLGPDQSSGPPQPEAGASS